MKSSKIVVYPAVREKSCKIAAFRDWIRGEAEQANAEYAALIR